MIRSLRFAFVFLGITAMPLVAQESASDKNGSAPFKPLLKQLDLTDGDTVVFLGDSITHQCLYTQ
jgi:hypothetical protein